MEIKIIKATEVTDEIKEKKDVSKEKKKEKKEDIKCICAVEDDIAKKQYMEILSKERILRCERIELGILGNCTICQGVNKELFVRCKNKWTGY